MPTLRRIAQPSDCSLAHTLLAYWRGLLVQSEGGREPVIGLNGANLRDIDLSNANLSGAYMVSADLDGADLSSAELSGANLKGTDLRGAELQNANLFATNLRDARLSGAQLHNVVLDGATLIDADGITKEKLKQQALSLRGAAMPDGTLQGGQHFTHDFEPALSFIVGDGWQVTHSGMPDAYIIQEKDSTALLAFLNSKNILDKDGYEIDTDINSWLKENPDLDTQEPRSVSVGAVDGQEVEVTVDKQTVPLFHLADGTVFSLGQSGTYRFIILPIHQHKVTIVFGNQKAQEILSTVMWQGG